MQGVVSSSRCPLQVGILCLIRNTPFDVEKRDAFVQLPNNTKLPACLVRGTRCTSADARALAVAAVDAADNFEIVLSFCYANRFDGGLYGWLWNRCALYSLGPF